MPNHGTRTGASWNWLARLEASLLGTARSHVLMAPSLQDQNVFVSIHKVKKHFKPWAAEA